MFNVHHPYFVQMRITLNCNALHKNEHHTFAAVYCENLSAIVYFWLSPSTLVGFGAWNEEEENACMEPTYQRKRRPIVSIEPHTHLCMVSDSRIINECDKWYMWNDVRRERERERIRASYVCDFRLSEKDKCVTSKLLSPMGCWVYLETFCTEECDRCYTANK